MSRRRSPASAAARAIPCAIRSIGLRPSATWPRSLSAAPTIAAPPRLRPLIARPRPAPLIGQLALLGIGLINRERRGFHRRGSSGCAGILAPGRWRGNPRRSALPPICGYWSPRHLRRVMSAWQERRPTCRAHTRRARMKLYHFPSPNPQKVTFALQELGLDCEIVPLDLAQGEQRQTDFLALNPFGRVPVLVDDGVKLWESHAMLAYLGEKTGRLWPSSAAGRADALKWLFFLSQHITPSAGEIAVHRIAARLLGLPSDH